MADERAYQTIHTSNQYHYPYDIAPLTTVWTAPQGCATVVDFQASFDHNSCVPPDFESVWYSGGFYSPGICPGAYTAGCIPNYSAFSPRPTETAVLCVPTSYSCDTFNLHAYSMSGGSKVTVPAFEIRWAESDISNLETTPTLPGATRTGSAGSSPTGGPTGASTGASSPSASGGSSSNGISTGAVAGIAVGAAALVAIIAAGLFLCWRRRNKRAAAQQGQTGPDGTAFVGGRAEMDASNGIRPDNSAMNKVDYGKTDAWTPSHAQEADNSPSSNTQYTYQQEMQELHGGHVHHPGHQGNPQELASQQYYQGGFPQEVYGGMPPERYELPQNQHWRSSHQ